MKKIKIAFDIDGTLRDNKEEYGVWNPVWATPNENIRSLLITLSKFKNVQCYIWSWGGKRYADDIRKKFLLEKYVKESSCLGKWDMIDGELFRPDIAIDDIQDCRMGHINLIVKEK